MKRILSLALVLLSLGLGVSLAEIKKGDRVFSLAAGLANPAGDFSDVADAGPFFGLNYRRYSSQTFSLGLDVTLSDFNEDGPFDSYAIGIGLPGRVDLLSHQKFHPYLSFAPALFLVETKVDSSNSLVTQGTSSSSKGGYFIALGGQYVPTGWPFLGLELRYQDASGPLEAFSFFATLSF